MSTTTVSILAQIAILAQTATLVTHQKSEACELELLPLFALFVVLKYRASKKLRQSYKYYFISIHCSV